MAAPHVSGLALAYFSPTGTTKRVLTAIAAGLGLPITGEYDLTLPGAHVPGGPILPHILVLAGAPVYGGRVPPVALRRLAALKGEGGMAVPVVVYGNRHYNDALLELADLLMGAGFVPVAAAAFIGEHSFSTADLPIAAGRPDSCDLEVAYSFGGRIAGVLTPGQPAAMSPQPPAPLRLPGTRPTQEPRPRTTFHPLLVDLTLCLSCGKCVTVCPVGAVSEGGRVSDRQACLHCHACVKACPAQARTIPAMAAFASRLAEQCRERREPEMFF